MRDGDLVHGARVRKLREGEVPLLVKDLSLCRRKLHQHGLPPYLTGNYELLLTALRGAPQAG